MNQEEKNHFICMNSDSFMPEHTQTNLVLLLHDSILLLPDGDFGGFILPQGSLLLQLRAPEGLDTVHRGT